MNKERALKTLLTYDGLGKKEKQEAIDDLLLEQGFEIVSKLKKMNGAIDYDGDCSVQVYFELKNGKRLRFGYNDEDGKLNIDQYEGLAIIGKDGQPKRI